MRSGSERSPDYHKSPFVPSCDRWTVSLSLAINQKDPTKRARISRPSSTTGISKNKKKGFQELEFPHFRYVYFRKVTWRNFWIDDDAQRFANLTRDRESRNLWMKIFSLWMCCDSWHAENAWPVVSVNPRIRLRNLRIHKYIGFKTNPTCSHSSRVSTPHSNFAPGLLNYKNEFLSLLSAEKIQSFIIHFKLVHWERETYLYLEL